MTLTEINKTAEMLPRVDWIVETGNQNVTYELWKEWDAKWSSNIELTFADRAIYRPYGKMEGRSLTLEAKCEFLKVNNVVVCLLQAVGRYADHSLMEGTVRRACGISTSFYGDRLSTAVNAGNILYNILSRVKVTNRLRKEYREQVENLTDEQKELFGSTEFIITVDGDLTSLNLKKAWADKEIKMMDIKETVFAYGTVSSDQESKELPCYAQCIIAKINQLNVAFIHNSGNYADHTKMRSSIGTWCTSKRRTFTSMDVPTLFEQLNSSSKLSGQIPSSLLPKLPRSAVPEVVPSAAYIQGNPVPLIPSRLLPQQQPALIANMDPFDDAIPKPMLEAPLLPKALAPDGFIEPIGIKPGIVVNNPMPIHDLIDFGKELPRPAAAELPRIAAEKEEKIAIVEKTFAKVDINEDDDDEENPFICPFTFKEFENPVQGSDGHTYSKAWIEDWLEKKGTSPNTMQPMEKSSLKPNWAVIHAIEAFHKMKAKYAKAAK